MKIIDEKINFTLDAICKCGCKRFIQKKINNAYIELLCVECEKIYILKIFTEEKKL